MLHRLNDGTCIDPGEIVLVRIVIGTRVVVAFRDGTREEFQFDEEAGAEAFRDEIATAAGVAGINAPPAELLSRSVGMLKLCVRGRNCMRKLGVDTIGQLVQHAPEDLLEVAHFGVTSLWEVREELHKLGLRLRGDMPIKGR